MDSILKSLIGSALESQQQQRQPQQQQRQADPVADIIGDMISGSQERGGGFGDILEGLMEAQGATAPRRAAPQPRSSGGMLDIIGSLIGGGNSRSASVNPIAKILSDRTGLSPAIAAMVVSFAMKKLLSGQAQKIGGAQQQSGSQRITPSQQRGGTQRGTGPSIDLDDLLDMMGDDDAVSSRIAETGIDRDLAEEAGIDQAQARNGLEELFKIFGAQREIPRPVAPPADDGLKGLLDDW